jgi:putative spermidine/putrescine transport system ATP-binding protein
MTAALRISNLSFGYATADDFALRHVDLDLEQAECLALLGPSGSGKTSILRLVAGLEKPTSGAVLLDGRNVAAIPTERRGLAMVFQRPLLFPHLSVRDNVAFGPRMAGASRRTARAQADRYLDLVGLGDYARRGSGELSGGQAQRIALARALAAEPSVLLLDEPFSALDPQLRSEMHELLEEVRRQLGPTILLVTHDRDEAVRLSDRITVLVSGQVLHTASAAELFRAPTSLEIYRFLGGRNEIRGIATAGRHVSGLGRLDVAGPDWDGVRPATMVIRQEAIRVTSPGSGADVSGVIMSVRPTSARQLLEVATVVGSLWVETAPGCAPRCGETIGLNLPASERWVVSERAEENQLVELSSETSQPPGSSADSVGNLRREFAR